MPLKIRIPAGEKIVVNGAVITNVDDRAMYIRLENEADFMRGRDVLQPQDVRSPLDEAYFVVQMLYIEPESRGENRARFTEAAKRAFLSTDDAQIQAAIFNAVGYVSESRFFEALAALRAVRKAA